MIKLLLVFLIFSVLFVSNSFAEQEIWGIYGDSQAREKTHKKILDGLVSKNPQMIFHVGDMVQRGRDLEEWHAFRDTVDAVVKTTPFYPALGNHDENNQFYYDYFDLPNNEQWYEVESNLATAIVLDSNASLLSGSEQYDWLVSALKKASGNDKWLFVFFHHPPYTIVGNHEDEKKMRREIIPLFEQYGVHMVFAGHAHTYERTQVKEVTYIVTGGGGGPLHEKLRSNPDSKFVKIKHHYCMLSFSASSLKLDVFDTKGREIESFEREKAYLA